MRPEFRWFVGSNTSGSLADGIATTAMPLFVLGLTTDPVLVALVPAALGLPWLLFSLHAGALVDRMDRRTVLWVADASRAALAATLMALVLFHAQSVPALLAVAFLEGTAIVAFRAASPAMLPSLVEREDLGRANGHIQTMSVVAGGFVGPALGGLLFPLTALAPFAVQSVSMLVSVLCLRRLPERPPCRDEARPTTVGSDIREGLRAVFTDRVLRSLAVTTLLLASSTGMLQAVLVLHVVNALGAPISAYGVLFTVYAAGCLVGTRLMPRVHGRFGARACLLLAASIGTASLLTVAIAANVYFVGVGMALLGIGSMLFNITAVTVRQERTPDALLGRVSSVTNLVGIGGIPLAAVLAGSIAAATSTTWALVAAAGACATGLLWLIIDMGSLETNDKTQEQVPRHTA
ncbi:MAG: transporter [Nocardioides sp.]|nr:transporter [Nocardioides sp.]